MGVFLTIMKNLILTRKISKDVIINVLNEMDDDRDGYVSTKEVITWIGHAIAIWSKDSNA